MDAQGESFEVASNSGLTLAMELDNPIGYSRTGFW